MASDFGYYSKIAVPQVYHEILTRPGIVKIIDGASLNEAVCIVAPYGYGKTLAVISWLRGRNAAWIDLNEFESDEKSVCDYCAIALSSLARNKTDDNFLNAPMYREDPWGFLSMIASGLEQDPEKIMVIDNFKCIQDVGTLRHIKNLISVCLGKLRVIIISRVELHPLFNDLMLKRRICLITIKALSFDAQEISDYFIMNDCEITMDDVLKLRDDTEGWAAALNVVLTVTRGGVIGYREASREYVRSFFETEIWSGLDEKMQDFLLKTSVLKVLTPASCHAVTGIGAALVYLNWLYLNGMFISKLDERDTYRYHSVFMDFLEDKLISSGIDEKKLYQKAAWWLHEKNEIEQSFPYFYKSGDLYGLSQVLKTINPSVMGIERFLDMTSCLMEMSIENLKQYPLIVARIALIHYLKGNVDEMQALYSVYLEWTEPGILLVAPEEYAEYLWEAGWLCYLDPGEEVRNNEKHIEWTNYKEYVPHLKILHRARGAVFRFPSMLRGIRDYTSIIDLVEPFLKHAEETGQSSVREEVSIWESYLVLAEHSYEIEDYKKSEDIVRRIMTLTENEQMTDLYFVCTVLMVKLLRALNTTKEIDSLIDRLEKMILNTKQYFLLPNFHAFQMRNMLADGKTEMTTTFEEENRRYAENPYYYLLYRHVTLVRAMISLGDYNEALIILGNLDIMCRKYKRTMDLIEITVLRSIALYGVGNEEGACLHLNEAIDGAKKFGFLRIFSDEAKNLWPIIEIVSKRRSDKYTKNIVLSCKKTLIKVGHKLPSKQGRHLTLTKTELKILKSLEISMSYEEIAMDNDIRISTVKSHVHSIYSKLEVDNRTSAILAARDLGIL